MMNGCYVPFICSSVQETVAGTIEVGTKHHSNDEDVRGIVQAITVSKLSPTNVGHVLLNNDEDPEGVL